MSLKKWKSKYPPVLFDMTTGIADIIGKAGPTKFIPTAIWKHSVTWTARQANDEFFVRCVGRFIEGLLLTVVFSFVFLILIN